MSSYYVFDFTCFDDLNSDEVKKILKDKCKKFTFQLEQCPTTLKKHYQGRLSLKIKKSSPKAVAKHLGVTWHFTVTSGVVAESGDMDYVSKDNTRLDGPWTEKEEAYIPSHFKKIKDNLFPWQQTIMDSRNEKNERRVNILYDPDGARGKSSIAGLMACQGLAILLPPTNDSDKLVQSLCNICMDKELRDPKCVFINLPRSMEQDKLYGIFKAIEQMKDGHLYDVRYHYKEYWIESPQIWVFMNELPKMTYLSADRWVIHRIADHTKELYQPDLRFPEYTERKK